MIIRKYFGIMCLGGIPYTLYIMREEFNINNGQDILRSDIDVITNDGKVLRRFATLDNDTERSNYKSVVSRNIISNIFNSIRKHEYDSLLRSSDAGATTTRSLLAEHDIVSSNNHQSFYDRELNTVKPENRTILFIHVGKAGGETMKEVFEFCCHTRSPRKKPKCLKNLPVSVLSSIVKGYQHGTGNPIPKNIVRRVTSLLINIRHPVDRLISWYGFVNPNNCQVSQTNSTPKYGIGTPCSVKRNFDLHDLELRKLAEPSWIPEDNNVQYESISDESQVNEDVRKPRLSEIEYEHDVETSHGTITNEGTDISNISSQARRKPPFEPFNFLKEFFICFPSLEQFANSLKPTRKVSRNPDLQACTAMARIVVEGGSMNVTSNSYPFYSHAYANYKMYHRRFIRKNLSKEILVVRTNHMWDDIKALEMFVGGYNTSFSPIDGSRYTHGSERWNNQQSQQRRRQLEELPSPVDQIQQLNDSSDEELYGTNDTYVPASSKSLSVEATQSLCCAMLSEIFIYKDILFRASNFDLNAKQIQWQNDIERCYFSTMDEMLLHCATNMPRLTEVVPLLLPSYFENGKLRHD